jgi:hypothetical protein
VPRWSKRVDAQHLGLVGRRAGDHRHGVGHRHRDDVGQVVLALCVVVLQRRDPALQRRGRRRHHAGVDLAQRAFVFARVLVLDDRAHAAAGAAHDAAVAARVGEGDRQQRQLRAAAGRGQRGGGGGAHERHVAVEDQRRLEALVERRQRLQHRVAGAELRLLAHEDRCTGSAPFDLGRAMAGDDDGARRPQRGGGVQNMLQ